MPRLSSTLVSVPSGAGLFALSGAEAANVQTTFTHPSSVTRGGGSVWGDRVDDMKVSFNTHLGGQVGQPASVSPRDQLGEESLRAESFFPTPDNCWVVNASAGVAVQCGKFKFRIHDQKIIFRGDWAKEIGRN